MNYRYSKCLLSPSDGPLNFFIEHFLLEFSTFRSILLALGIRDVHTYQICHVSIDLWGCNLSTKT